MRTLLHVAWLTAVLGLVRSALGQSNDLIGPVLPAHNGLLDGVCNDLLGDAPDKPAWEVPQGFRPYKSTKWTQSLFVLDGQDARRVETRSQSKWIIPGGLEGLSGWESKLWVKMPEGADASTHTRLVSVAFAPRLLPRRGWEFAEGTTFIDALHNDKGELFEARMREKTKTKWVYSVPFRDMDLAPKGYKGPGKACISCHERAGASEVYGALNPGDDETFSFDDDGRLLGIGPDTVIQSVPAEVVPSYGQSYGRGGLFRRGGRSGG